MATTKRHAKGTGQGSGTPAPNRRARLIVVGAVVLSAGILAAWFPAGALLHQRSNLADDTTLLNQLHSQDAALAQEHKNLSAAAEISRIAREQYQLVSPGQQAYEVLPPAGTAAKSSTYPQDPGIQGPIAPSASVELPPGSAPSGQSQGSSGHNSSSSSQPSAFDRMLHALEFWR